MKRNLIFLMLTLLTMNVCVACGSSTQKANNESEPTGQAAQTNRRGAAKVDKSNDMELKALIDQNLNKFSQFEFADPETGKNMSYNLFMPEGYDKNRSYPLVLFMADASTVGKDVTAPLTQGYGGLVWVTAESQAENLSFVLVPQYTKAGVNDQFETSDEVEMTIRLLNHITDTYHIDRNRLYTTGQSMGGMMSMYFNIAHPDLFAASIFVGCQWDTSKMAGFANDNFFYIVAAGDEKAPKGMADLKTVLQNENAKFGTAEWSAKLPQEEQEAEVQKLLSEGYRNNFVVFTLGSVMPENGQGNEHMCSFDYAYKLKGVRNWLFKQTK